MKRKYIIGLLILVVIALIIFRLAANKSILDKKKLTFTRHISL